MNFSHEDLLRPKDYNGKPIIFKQVKYNGIRVLIRKSEQVTAFTRNGKTDLWPWLRKILPIATMVQDLPNDTCLDCELWAEGFHETDIVTLWKACDGRLQLTIFAAPFFSGEDWRSRDLGVVMLHLEERGLPIASTQRMFGKAHALTDATVESMKMLAKSLGLEGYVLKTGHYDGWWKVKPCRTCDAVVLDYSISDSLTHFGKLKAIKVGLEGEEIASVGSGFDQEWRHSVDPKTLIGRVCEIEYDCLAANGKLKFPRFLRWRDDKTPGECTKEQLR